MKLSLNWLKDYVAPKLSTADLVERLTMAGLEVETVESFGADKILDLEITPNRPDCLSILGLAREIAAITGKDLKFPKVPLYKASKGAVSISVEDKKDCGRYIGTLIQDTSVASSPQNMQERLNSLGLRPINNAVDVTNFVLMELGQPLHAFDYDKLAGGKISVRRAKAGEKIVTLDGIERKLDPSILVIADAKGPVAIAGVMGGQGTQITAATKNILLESAQFDMGLVRRASRKLGLKSDSSYRFERGVDLDGVLTAANRATDLLLKLTQGKFAGRADTAAGKKSPAQNISLSESGIEQLLGTKISSTAVKSALSRLGLKVTAKNRNLKITVPGFRTDLKQPVDIIEEAARMIGYDRLAASFPNIQVANIAERSRPRQVKKIVAEALIAAGYDETITYSLINQKDLDKSGLNGVSAVGLRNALSQEHNLLRPSLLPSLLSVALSNVNQGQKDLRFFEIGKCYLPGGERTTLAVLATGRQRQDWRTNGREHMDSYDVKGVLEQIFCKLGAEVNFAPGSEAGLDPAGCAQLKVQGKDIGVIGQVHKQVLNQWDIKTGPVYFAQIDLESLFELPHAATKYQPVAEFPAIQRDVSIAVKTDISYAKIEELCLRLGRPLLRSMQLIEEYKGDKIQAGSRGLVFSLVYQSPQRTLREEDVNSVHYNILKALTTDFAAIQR